MASAALAKLSRPRLAGVHPRERLFARLDELRGRGAVWISGPPGAGKTTLVASYLDARSLPVLWYQVDAGDADPASFFYYLGLGAKQAGLSRKSHLPLLTPEYLPDLAGFTRRFVRAMCQGLPQPCVLVLDNVQEAPEGSAFASVISAALGDIPPGFDAVLISRTGPPGEHARLRATRALAELSWDELKLSADEAKDIAVGRGIAPAAVERLVRRCDGWAAGLTLLLEHVRATGVEVDTPDSRQSVFDYFGAELLSRLPEPTQRLLLSTSLLPWVNAAMASVLTGNEDAGAILESLRRRHLFTERRAGMPPSYQYHGLLKEFLEGRVEATWPAADRTRLRLASARLLAEVGEVAAALPLYLAATEHQAAVQLVLGNAPGLAAQGRLQTLAAWIVALPKPLVEAIPWLMYWQGMCRLGVSPDEARTHLEAAFERFEASNETLGQTMATAGIIETYSLEVRDLRPAARWTIVLLQLLDRDPTFPDPGIELGALGSLLGALVMLDPAHSRLPALAARVLVLLDGTPDVNGRMAGACRLLHYHVFLNNPQAGRDLVAQIRPLLVDPNLLPLHHCTWLHMESAYFQFNDYDERQGSRAIESALAIVEREGFAFYALMLHARAAMFRMEASDLEGATALLARVESCLGVTGLDVGWYHGLKSWIALTQGRCSAAVEHAQRLVDACSNVGGSHSHFMALLWQANAWVANGDTARAMESVEQSRRVNVTRQATGQFSADLIEADIRVDEGNLADGEVLLRGAMALGRQVRLFNTLQWLPKKMSRLCAFALERDIEPEFVSELIRLRRLPPPSPDVVAWPWPLRIHGLGSFGILKDDQALRFEGKAQRRPLALLKALIALGGSEVPEHRLIDIVWGSSLEGDEQKAFDVTLHRLRKLLGQDKALQVSDRHVSLNPECVWVDLWALDRRLTRLLPVASQAPPSEMLATEAPAILDLYRGQFLAGDADEPWLLPVRNRLNGRFQRFVIRLGEHWEQGGQWERAAELYERGVELDPLAETFYRGLMVCRREQGRRAEAIEVFRRCRQMLSVTLGVQPTAQTEAVYRQLIGP